MADEQGGEIRLRGWESPAKGSRKNLKHLCGQKCVQRMMDNFTAALMAGLQVSRSAKEAPAVAAAVSPEVRENTAAVEDLEDLPVLERLGYDRETAAMIEAESWAGPVRPKETPKPAPAPTWGAESGSKSERESFVNAIRSRSQTQRAFQRSA
ncbi:MAG TPA: hypothetical protein VL495_09065 [Edaphobacter sp.]|nr:hypothetical protein [Edaphobacter sp.]